MKFYERLKKEKTPLCGIWSVMDSGISSEIICYSGFDWVVIDCQHPPTSLETVRTITQIIGANSRLGVLVRVPTIESWCIQRVLDIGVDGIIVPSIKTASEVKAVIDSSLYPPIGSRGISTTMIRATQYGLDKQYLNRANESMVIVIQVETKEAVENLDAILKVQGVTGIFPGPKDLAGSIGCMDNFQHPKLLAMIEEVEQKTIASNLLLAGGASSTEGAAKLLKKGYRLISIGSDAAMLANTVNAAVNAFRNATKK